MQSYIEHYIKRGEEFTSADEYQDDIYIGSIGEFAKVTHQALGAMIIRTMDLRTTVTLKGTGDITIQCNVPFSRIVHQGTGSLIIQKNVEENVSIDLQTQGLIIIEGNVGKNSRFTLDGFGTLFIKGTLEEKVIFKGKGNGTIRFEKEPPLSTKFELANADIFGAENCLKQQKISKLQSPSVTEKKPEPITQVYHINSGDKFVAVGNIGPVHFHLGDNPPRPKDDPANNSSFTRTAQLKSQPQVEVKSSFFFNGPVMPINNFGKNSQPQSKQINTNNVQATFYYKDGSPSGSCIDVNELTDETKSYKESREKKRKTIESLEKIVLTDEEEKKLQKFEDSLFFTTMVAPVYLNGRCNDLDSLLKVLNKNGFKDPVSSKPVILRELQPAIKVANKLDDLVKKIIANHAKDQEELEHSKIPGKF